MCSFSFCGKAAVGVLVVALAASFLSPVSAVECFTDLGESKNTLKKALETCQEQIDKTEKVLQEQQAVRTNTEYDILLIEQEINKALLRIRSSDTIIRDLDEDITVKGATVSDLNEKLKSRRKFLSEVHQRINEAEQRGFLNLLISDVTVSAFVSGINEYMTLHKTLGNSIRNINSIRQRLISTVDDLEDKKVEQGRIRQERRATANQIKSRRGQKKEILNHQLSLEEKTQEKIDEYETRAAQIRNRLFEFRGGAIPFEQALTIAEEVSRRTGLRPAFLLGLIKHESDLGKNVGTGTYRNDMHPTRDQPIFPFIAKMLGFDPDKLRVSANPGFGWGGAMGPAQFIPSTWVCYGGLINTKTNTCSITNSYIKTTKLLEIGSRGGDVKRLQQFLNRQGFTVAASGPGSPGKETTYYGDNVAQAVSRFQEHYAKRILHPYGRTKGAGVVGPLTRTSINQLYFYSGPWKYRANKDVIRQYTKNDRPSNPWNPRDAFFASGIYLKRLGAENDECTAARRYYAGANWRKQIALNYCRAVISNARIYQRDIDYLKKSG